MVKVSVNRAIIGSIIILLLILAVYSLSQIACYELRICSGDLQAYTTNAIIAIVALYIMAVIHVVLSKFQKQK